MFREIGCGSLTSRKRFGTALFAALVSILPVVSNPVAAEVLTPQQQLAFDIYKELVEINTVTATGDTARVAEAMAVRLRAAGFADADVHVFSPAPHKGNLVARLRGTAPANRSCCWRISTSCRPTARTGLSIRSS